MNDHIKSEISAYLAGELPESRNRQIEAHAASCDKCRNALSKARAKQARVKREALKKASPDDMPNLFLARQRKAAGMDAASHGKTWAMILFLVAASGGYWAYHKKVANVPAEPPTPAAATEPEPAPPPPVHKPAAKPPVADDSLGPANPPVVLHVQEDWKGSDSAVTESRLMVIRTAEAWQKLWTEMALKDPLPEVDFTKQLVLAVFAGENPAGTSVLLGRIELSDEEVSAPYRIQVPSAPAAVSTSTDAAAAVPLAPSHPYLLAAIQRVDKKIKLTQREKRS
jgi:hypothetical protein